LGVLFERGGRGELKDFLGKETRPEGKKKTLSAGGRGERGGVSFKSGHRSTTEGTTATVSKRKAVTVGKRRGVNPESKEKKKGSQSQTAKVAPWSLKKGGESQGPVRVHKAN